MKKARKRPRYWAVGLNFGYTIIGYEPDSAEYGSVEGPFYSLPKAKAQVRKWIRSDRHVLSCQLQEVNALKAEDVEK